MGSIGHDVLKVEMQENDAEAETIKDYLIRLLAELWEQGECFSGKHPLGNSGWEYDLYLALAQAGMIEADLYEEDGYTELIGLSDEECNKAIDLIRQAIQSL